MFFTEMKEVFPSFFHLQLSKKQRFSFFHFLLSKSCGHSAIITSNIWIIDHESFVRAILSASSVYFLPFHPPNVEIKLSWPLENCGDGWRQSPWNDKMHQSDQLHRVRIYFGYVTERTEALVVHRLKDKDSATLRHLYLCLCFSLCLHGVA